MDPIPFPSNRDPNLVFVGMPTRDGAMSLATRILFDLVGDGKRLGPYTFISRLYAGYDTATARNQLTAVALGTRASKMLLLDSDMGGGEPQVLRILGHKEAIVGGLYPKKELSINPKWVCNFIGFGKRPDGLAEALDVGAGFLKVDLAAVEWMISENPDAAYLSEEDWNRGARVWALWDPLVAEDDWGLTGRWTRRLSDDFAFCYRARRAGLKVWVDTVCQLGHVGPVDFLEVMTLLQLVTAPADAAPRDPASPRA